MQAANITNLSTELLSKIFADLEHDELQSLLPQCRKIATVARPMLINKRKFFLAALKPIIHEGKSLIGQSEVYLIRVLRTNEKLSGLANNVPVGEEAQNGHSKNTDWLAQLLGIYDHEQEYFASECRANTLVEIAKSHCYQFGIFYQRNVTTMESMYLCESEWDEGGWLGSQTMELLKKRINFLFFEEFMQKYPALSKFTTVQWPEGMPQEQRCKLAKEYAQKNEAENIRKRPTRKGRMFQMRMNGNVGHPNTKKTYNYGEPLLDNVWKIYGLGWQVMDEEEMY